MKYPRYVYKRLNGQEYHYGVGDSFLEEMKEKNSPAGTGERIENNTYQKYNMNWRGLKDEQS